MQDVGIVLFLGNAILAAVYLVVSGREPDPPAPKLQAAYIAFSLLIWGCALLLICLGD